ncbi:ATP-binding protein [Streptomyces sp. NPDC086549]|uniref:ATP-binding protein n=1 Tax=Streptomyces sp. NPDC086549 TaxID=3365752 RepID=UPI003830A173
MAPPSLPQPLDRLSEDPLPGRFPGARLPIRPPGGEYTGRLPGPDGPDRLVSGAEPPRRTHVFVLPATPASVATARRGVREVLTGWGADEDACDDAAVVTSELVTNAVTHSKSDRIVCRLHSTAHRIRIEVEDQNRGTTLPTPGQPDPDDQSGRGLLLVDALSEEWGVTGAPHRSGRIVWADLTSGTDTPPATATLVDRPVPHSAEGPLPHGLTHP